MPRVQGPSYKGRYWVFTWNNPVFSPDELHTAFDRVGGVDYLVFQKETAPTTGTPHYQGYVETKKRVTLATLKKVHVAINWQKRMGNREQANAYATKEDTRTEGPWNYGELPTVTQGDHRS